MPTHFRVDFTSGAIDMVQYVKYTRGCTYLAQGIVPLVGPEKDLARPLPLLTRINQSFIINQV